MIEDNFGITRRSFVGGSSALGLIAAAAADASAAKTEGRPEATPVVMPVADPIDRAFIRLNEGLVHYRHAGPDEASAKLPLYLAHAGPGSSRGMVGMMREFCPTRVTIAPDMLGNGDSAPPARENTDMLYYADCAVRLLDKLKIEKIDFFGSHTGAQIGCELAVKWPDRVRRLVMDGLPLFPEDFRKQLLEHYAPKVEPDDFGGHLMWAWSFVRDQSQYWPHFIHNAENRLANGVSSPRDLQAGVVDVLKCLDTYRIAYQAAFAQDVRSLLPKVKIPVMLIASERDPLHFYLEDVAALLPGAKKMLFERGTNPADRVNAIRQFFDS